MIMRPIFSTIKFEAQLSLLEDCNDWLRKIRVATTGTRFEQILLLFRTIVEHYRCGTIQDLLENHDEGTLYYVITGATSFIEVFQAFSSMKDHMVPRRKLTEALRGPLLPWDEQPSSGDTHGRNTLFELETAAWFNNCGLPPTKFDDVEFVFDSHTFNVQCKRIYSARKVEDNVRSAVDQVTDRMTLEARTKGIICLCVDKISDKEGHILEVNHPEEITPIMDKIGHDFVDKHNHIWQRLVNNDILAAAVVVKILASIRQEPHPLLTACRTTVLDIIPNNAFYQQYDYNLIKKLSAKLGASRLITT